MPGSNYPQKRRFVKKHTRPESRPEVVISQAANWCEGTEPFSGEHVQTF
jgi:hypothetical protein